MAVADGEAGPDVGAAAEDFRPADEVSLGPVGQRDLATGGAGVVGADAAGFDQKDAVMAVALMEDRGVGGVGEQPAGGADALAFGFGQGREQVELGGGIVGVVGQQ